MRLLVLLKEDGKRYIYNENGAEAMDIVDEKSNPFALKQLINLDSYLEEKAKFLANDKHVGQSEEGIGTTMKISTERLAKYIEHGSDTKEPFFQYKVQCIMLIRTAVLKAGVKENIACTWWKNMKESRLFYS